EAAARTYREQFPVPYPSYSDPDKEIAAVIKATLGFPSTAFYDSGGELVYTKQGGYASQAELEADIRRYALSG
ncbi:MAG: TlpA family protein disulfide reductase, partial [Solirubrobacterales bacterium]